MKESCKIGQKYPWTVIVTAQPPQWRLHCSPRWYLKYNGHSYIFQKKILFDIMYCVFVYCFCARLDYIKFRQYWDLETPFFLIGTTCLGKKLNNLRENYGDGPFRFDFLFGHSARSTLVVIEALLSQGPYIEMNWKKD